MVTSTLGFSYSEASSSGDPPIPIPNNIQFQSNPSQEIYDMIGFPPDHHLIKPQDGNNSTIPHQNQNQNQFAPQDPSLSFVSPNDQRRPIQGQALSLTLSSSSNPSCIKLQPFQLRPPDETRFGPSSSRSGNYQQKQPQIIQQGLLQMRNSRYLNPAQELLNELCSLDAMKRSEEKRIWEENNEDDAMRKQSLYALDLLQLQRRRTKLLHMLQEVNGRYRHYCNKMKMLVSSLEAAVGDGFAAVYTSMALRAMSQHFRCLKDGILSQIKVTKKAMGAKDVPATLGTAKGKTSRLRILDQSLRQHRGFQQLSITENYPWQPQRGLPQTSVNVLRAWLFQHFLHPYPSDVDKHILARQTGLSRNQVSNWFINARVRIWKPMVEAMYLEDLKETQPSGDPGPQPLDRPPPNQNNYGRRILDQKPTQEQIIRVVEPDTLSSIIVNNSSAENTDQRLITSSTIIDEYGATIQSGFSLYGGHNSSSSSFGDVSLTLGLHQHGGRLGLGSYSHAEATVAAENPIYYPKHGMEDSRTVQYSLMEGENQNLPYRNLTGGAQLLHDLAG